MIDRLIKFTTAMFFLFFPLYFIPLGNTSSDYDKQIILLVFSFLLFILTAVKTIRGKKVTLARTPFDIFFILLTLLYLFSSLIVSPNKIESLLSPVGTASILSLTLLYFSLTSASLPITLLLISAILLSIPIIARQFNSNINIFPLGSYYSTALFLTPLVVYSVVAFIRPGLSWLKGLAFLILTSSLALSVYHLFTDQKPILLPAIAGWAILLESYKNIVHFLLGVGPNNFSSAYALGKPLFLNNTPFGNTISYLSSSFLFTVATEVGILGGLIILVIFLKIVKLLYKQGTAQSNASGILLPPAISFLILLLLPVQLPFLILAVIFLAAASPQKIKQFTLPIANKLTVYLTLTLLVVSALLLYWPLKSYWSDLYLRSSLVASNSRLLGDALNFSQKSIGFNPYSERAYSLSSTLTLEALRNVVQTSNASDSAEIVRSLTGQAITHAKKTTQLNPQKSENWGLLGDTYQSLSGIAENADAWALNAYNQQMLLNPYSPQVKVSAGGLSMTAGDYETAALLFRQAINLKPDWNNAYYNLAILYARNQNYQGAMMELQKALQFTAPDTADYRTLQSETGNLQNLLAPPATPSGSNNIKNKQISK